MYPVLIRNCLVYKIHQAKLDCGLEIRPTAIAGEKERRKNSENLGETVSLSILKKRELLGILGYRVFRNDT